MKQINLFHRRAVGVVATSKLRLHPLCWFPDLWTVSKSETVLRLVVAYLMRTEASRDSEARLRACAACNARFQF
jgi:hypothetical protein